MKPLEKENRLPIFALLLFYFLLVIRNAWISDDAMITFRVVENFLAGYGLGYNPFVRVQAFTHPLWMLAISFVYFLQRIFVPSSPNALYYITIFLSVLYSFLAVFLLVTRVSGNSILSSSLLILILSLSSGFVDFSTSGLENPLTHFLMVIFVLVYLAEKQNLFLLSFISSLIILNRMDAFILVLPSLFYSWLISKVGKSGLFKIFTGLIPVMLWELFSIFYFGFPFPNTAYAKLNTGISGVLLVQQGIDYLLNSINWDPIVIFSIGLAGFSLYLFRNNKMAVLFTGIMLYLGYVIKIGGDFMSGRFLTAPLFLSTVIISDRISSKRDVLVGLGIVVLLGAFSLRSPLLSSNMVLYLPDFPIGDRNFISDQRLYYFGNPQENQYNSFVENGFRDADLGSNFAGDKWYFTRYKKVMVIDALGKVGYQKGPNIFIIDNYALSDPLLARLPVKNKYWLIGHFHRDLPEGYFETLESGENMIADPDLALYFSKLDFVTKGPLWDVQRIVEIWKVNTGQYDYLLKRYLQRMSGNILDGLSADQMTPFPKITCSPVDETVHRTQTEFVNRDGSGTNFFAVNLNQQGFAGMHDPVSAVVIGQSVRVDYTVVGGKFVVKEGQLVTIDECKLVEKHIKASKRLLAG
jgi:arabinofuranosyltransferase